MELGRGRADPTAFFDDVDRSYVVAQLEGAMDEPVELQLAVRRPPSLLLPGSGAGASRVSDEARRAEQLARELEELVPKLRVTTSDGDDVPVFTVACPGAGAIRFVGVPRVNLFRALLEAIRRASTHDHGLSADWTRALGALPAGVHARVFATPT